MRVSKLKAYFVQGVGAMYFYPYGRYKTKILFTSHAAFSASHDLEFLRAKEETAELTLRKLRLEKSELASELKFPRKLNIRHCLYIGELDWTTSWPIIYRRKVEFEERFNIDETLFPPFIF